MNRLTKKERIETWYTKGNVMMNCHLSLYEKLQKLEDIEDELKKHTFYGKVWQFPNELMELRFIEIGKGNDYDLDIRIVFEVIGYGNVFYNIFQYGKTWALSKKELEENEKKN